MKRTKTGEKRMKATTAIAAVFCITGLLVMAVGCLNSTSSPILPAQTTGESLTGPPSYEYLASNGFVYAAIPRITAEDLKRRLDSGEEIILIDNRSKYKFKMGHLAGAINITCAINSPFPGEEEEMDRELAVLPNDVLKVFYCD